ncbi:MAG: DNA-binding transcriptional regulator [Alicyclobacillus sp.]|nr:sugar-binding domain-containing protein [Alicyclobacillus sp.]MCL6517486.1 DNA-binding transcriptional regulator [Alicyclobacillus sp.]
MELSAVRRIVPELVETLQTRVQILHRIRLMQPVGRRALAAAMGITERVLRAEVEFLRRQGLLVFHPAGMSLSEPGYALLDQLEDVLAAVEGRSELAQRLSRVLRIPRVTVVQGDSDQESWVKDTLGLQAALLLREALTDGDVLAVTGGTTMSAVAEMMPSKGPWIAVKVVPARGGLGENVDIQSNTIAARLAKRLGGTSIMLHVPDQMSPETLEHLSSEPLVQERLQEVREATVIVHGIGDALTMARRRQLSREEQAVLRERGAVAEAFGYFFNEEGTPVHAMTTVGLRLEDLGQLRLVMAVAGGGSKARAIAAAAKGYRVDVLVTDEGAARGVLGMAREMDEEGS